MTKTSPPNKADFAARLLDWYDTHARTLPWRVGPAERAAGKAPDPYRVWLSEVMLQQTTVATVTPRYRRFLERWPTVAGLASAPEEEVLGEWAGLGYYARARNLHACAKVVAGEHVGTFPQTEEGLLALPGIGAYTAAAIAAIAFDEPAVVVDGNVDRVIVRQFAIARPVKEAKADIRARAAALTPDQRPGDYAQAMMDLGATVCRPTSPQCLLCPVREGCDAHAEGIAESLPAKPKKAEKPHRQGTVFVGVLPSGGVVTERRPAKGLFGGMAGFPGGDWAVEKEEAIPPYAAAWEKCGEATHTLTHFHLTLTVMAARVEDVPAEHFETPPGAEETLPTVFRKALAVARATPGFHLEEEPKAPSRKTRSPRSVRP